MIAVFISNKLVSTDTVLPLLFELADRADAGEIRLYTANMPTYQAILRNQILMRGIEEIGSLVFIGAKNRSWLGRILHRVTVLPNLLPLALRAMSGQLTLVHFGMLNGWPFRGLFLINRKRTFYMQQVAVGHSKTESAIDGLVVARRVSKAKYAAGAIVGFQNDWSVFQEPEIAKLPRYIHHPTQNLARWLEFVEHQADTCFDEAFRKSEIIGAPEILTIMLGFFGPLSLLSHDDAVLESFHETIEALIETAEGRPIFVKPHIITDDDVLRKALSRYPDAQIIVSHLHPALLATRSRAFIANYYSTTLYTGRLLGIPTIEYSRYSVDALAQTGGGSMRPEAVSHFVNGDKAQLRNVIRLCLDQPRGAVDRVSAKSELLDALINCPTH